jgi:hypothetical protein
MKVNQGIDPSPSLSPTKQFEEGYSTVRGDEPEIRLDFRNGKERTGWARVSNCSSLSVS